VLPYASGFGSIFQEPLFHLLATNSNCSPALLFGGPGVAQANIVASGSVSWLGTDLSLKAPLKFSGAGSADISKQNARVAEGYDRCAPVNAVCHHILTGSG
jgi:hypothetical protein